MGTGGCRRTEETVLEGAADDGTLRGSAFAGGGPDEFDDSLRDWHKPGGGGGWVEEDGVIAGGVIHEPPELAVASEVLESRVVLKGCQGVSHIVETCWPQPLLV